MIITKKIAEAIVEKNKMFAPSKAKVILIHDDGRVVFAEKFEQGCAFWFADTMRESKLQGIIYKLTLVAKRNDQGDWVTVCDFSSKVDTRPKSRQERILEAQEKLVAARTSPVIKPAVISPSIDLPPVSQKAVEQSIRDNVMADKRLDTARKNVEIRDQEAKANQKLTTSLTPEYLQHEYNMVLQSCANSGKCTLIVDGSGSSKMLNVGK
ncbi:hypothetical protein selz497L_195 [Salmonella phage SenALZ1]|nr:hypothetical protein selz497L_195 [Salmonella phage SenALZ1]